MDNGFVRLPHSLFRSPAWTVTRRFSTFEAYLDLLRRAYWRNAQYFHRGQYIALEPGDLLTTSARLAQFWGWTRDDVRRWLQIMRDHRVLTCAVVEGLLKISLDPYCNAQFTKSPDPAAPATAGGKGGVLSSSEKEEEKNTSSVLTSSEKKEIREEVRTEDILSISSSEEEKKTSDLSPARESAEQIVDRVIAAMAKPARPRLAPGSLTENSQRLVELREQCAEPVSERTAFPPDFPMEEFRAYVDAAMKSKDRRIRPQLGRGWLATLRDRFLAEKAAAGAAPPEERRAA